MSTFSLVILTSAIGALLAFAESAGAQHAHHPPDNEARKVSGENGSSAHDSREDHSPSSDEHADHGAHRGEDSSPGRDAHASHDMQTGLDAPQGDSSSDEHAGHGTHASYGVSRETEQAAANEHAGHDNHAAHAPEQDDAESGEHAGHDMRAGHGAKNMDLPADAEPRTPIPKVTDADRSAAFPPTKGHAAHDRSVNSYWLADRFEWQDTEEGSLGWEGLAWVGGDINRLWLRSEGETADGDIESGDIEVLYGRAVGPWWDAVTGIKHDFGEGPSRTWAAFGLQGLAPYKFEVEATAYAGSSGRTALTLEAEYDTLFTNRWILQWQGEATLFGKDDPDVGVGSGLSTIELGARLRYEITRQFAPYVGVEYQRAFGDTADYLTADGHDESDARLVAGIRFWF